MFCLNLINSTWFIIFYRQVSKIRFITFTFCRHGWKYMYSQVLQLTWFSDSFLRSLIKRTHGFFYSHSSSQKKIVGKQGVFLLGLKEINRLMKAVSCKCQDYSNYMYTRKCLLFSLITNLRMEKHLNQSINKFHSTQFNSKKWPQGKGYLSALSPDLMFSQGFLSTLTVNTRTTQGLLKIVNVNLRATQDISVFFGVSTGFSWVYRFSFWMVM